MEILEAYAATGSAPSVAALVAVGLKTAHRCVAADYAGRPVIRSARHPGGLNPESTKSSTDPSSIGDLPPAEYEQSYYDSPQGHDESVAA